MQNRANNFYLLIDLSVLKEIEKLLVQGDGFGDMLENN